MFAGGKVIRPAAHGAGTAQVATIVILEKQLPSAIAVRWEKDFNRGHDCFPFPKNAPHRSGSAFSGLVSRFDGRDPLPRGVAGMPRLLDGQRSLHRWQSSDECRHPAE